MWLLMQYVRGVLKKPYVQSAIEEQQDVVKLMPVVKSVINYNILFNSKYNSADKNTLWFPINVNRSHASSLMQETNHVGQLFNKKYLLHCIYLCHLAQQFYLVWRFFPHLLCTEYLISLLNVSVSAEEKRNLYPGVRIHTKWLKLMHKAHWAKFSITSQWAPALPSLGCPERAALQLKPGGIKRPVCCSPEHTGPPGLLHLLPTRHDRKQTDFNIKLASLPNYDTSCFAEVKTSPKKKNLHPSLLASSTCHGGQPMPRSHECCLFRLSVCAKENLRLCELSSPCNTTVL